VLAYLFIGKRGVRLAADSINSSCSNLVISLNLSAAFKIKGINLGSLQRLQ